jgi:hypothetical protein
MADGEPQLQLAVPDDKVAGVYADFARVWHSSDVFTLDFAAVVGPPQAQRDPVSGQAVPVTQAQVVSRVRIPPGQVFEVMRALEKQLSMWERERGRRPGTPGDPPPPTA